MSATDQANNPSHSRTIIPSIHDYYRQSHYRPITPTTHLAHNPSHAQSTTSVIHHAESLHQTKRMRRNTKTESPLQAACNECKPSAYRSGQARPIQAECVQVKPSPNIPSGPCPIQASITLFRPSVCCSSQPPLVDTDSAQFKSIALNVCLDGIKPKPAASNSSG